MIGLINKFLSKDENLSLFYPVFQRLKKNTEVEKIFKSISEFSEKSEVRYVGGCVRKIINQEEVDDIDLATNIEPTEVIEILKKDTVPKSDNVSIATKDKPATIAGRAEGKIILKKLRFVENPKFLPTSIKLCD